MSGRNAPRSKNGCSTCRRRKVKCGEERPVCTRCLKLSLACEWGVPVKRGSSTVQIRHLQPAPTVPDQGLWSPTIDAGDVLGLPPDAFLTGFSPVSWSGDPMLLDAPHPMPSCSSVAPIRDSTPLYPPLSTLEMACANSLTLTQDDQKYFQYFPSSSIVYYYMKGWPWSSFGYLYQGPAATNKVIMRMILALAASDMHRHGLLVRSPGRRTADDHGRYHYSLAVKEFRQLLETPRRQVSVEELESIFATMFLMVTYEWQFGHSVRHLQLHLHGVRSLLDSHPQLFHSKDVNDMFLNPELTDHPSLEDDTVSKVSFISEQFLLWMLYIDASCRPMGLTESLYDYVAQSNNSALNPDNLHRCARLWGRCFWGEQYPDQEMLDDIENYRALELLHFSFCTRHRTWKVLVDSGAETDTADTLFQSILSARDQYSDLIITAKFAGSVSARRTLNTIYMAVCTFYAQILLHRRLLCVDSVPTAIHLQATTGIIDIAQKQYISDSRLLRRLHWPLLMAVIETHDLGHRQWLRERLFEFHDFHSEYRWANEIASQILAQQDVNQGIYVNMANLLLERLHE